MINEILNTLDVVNAIYINDKIDNELKVKIIKARILYNTIKTQFDLKVQEYANSLVTDEYKTLVNKSNKTEEDEKRINEIVETYDKNIYEFSNKLAKETEATTKTLKLDDDDFCQLFDINFDRTVNLKNKDFSGIEFMELVYHLFVK